MARILVVGGFPNSESDASLYDGRKAFAAALGREIIAQNHVLLGGCRTALDAEVANAAAAMAVQRNINPRLVVRSWVTKLGKPSHGAGEIVRSRLGDWDHVPRGFAFPEPIREADVMIVLGGWDGTHSAASWARLSDKPMLPVAAFGLAAAEIFDDEMNGFDRRYAARITLDDFQILNRLLASYDANTIEQFAKDVVTMDMVMPEMDGIAAVKAIVSEFPQAKIIMCTSMGQQALVEVIQAGAKVMITKPFQPAELIEAIETLLA